MEEPELPEHHRGGEQDRSDQARDGHERKEPDEILGRDELREHKHGSDGRCSRDHDPIGIAPRTRQPEHGQDRADLQQRRRHTEYVGKRTGEVSRDRRRRAGHNLGVVQAEPVGREQEGPAEALHLKRPLQLRVEAVPEALRADKSEGDEDEGNGAGEGEQGTAHAPPPDDEAKER